MSYEHYWVLLAFAWVFGWAGISILMKYLQHRNRLKLREMIHKERMIAIEKGIPLSKLPEEDPTLLKDEKLWAAQIFGKMTGNHYGRKLALALGLVILFGAIGWIITLSLFRENTLFEIGLLGRGSALLGIIPLMIGIGLILYYRLARESKSK